MSDHLGLCDADTAMVGKTESYIVELRVNGVAVPGRVFQRTHQQGVNDAASIAGSAGLFLKKNDVITLHLSVISPNGRVYRVPADTASMTVVRSRIFG